LNLWLIILLGLLPLHNVRRLLNILERHYLLILYLLAPAELLLLLLLLLEDWLELDEPHLLLIVVLVNLGSRYITLLISLINLV